MSPVLGSGAEIGPVPPWDRMGRYIRRELPTWGELLAVPWPVEVEWNERRLRAILTRGELVLTMDTNLAPWYLPCTRRRAEYWLDYLSRLLAAHHARHRDADETGRRRLRLTPPGAAEPVELLLEPGVYEGGVGGGNMVLFHRRGWPWSGMGLHLQKAIEEGWVRVVR